MKEFAKNFLLTLVTVVLMLPVCEAAFRLWHGISLFDTSNFRNTRVIHQNLSAATRYDPTLGWVLKSDLRNPGFTTLQYGIRRNNIDQTGIRPGNILVVGSSFTAGSEVSDENTWSAQLEQLTGMPVDNAASGGWGLDQVVLRAEELLPIARPKILLIGISDGTIVWSSYASMGRPKPYFSVNDGKLVEHNIPVPFITSEVDRVSLFEPIKEYLGYSFLIDRLMAAIDPQGWYARVGSVVKRVQNDPVDVTARPMPSKSGFPRRADGASLTH